MGLPVRKSKVAPPPTCPLSEVLGLLRGAWAPNVIWQLSGEPRRFGELRHDMPKISARVLSARLRELESRGLVTRRVLHTSPPSAEYSLTPLGRELLPAIDALACVGMKLIDEWETNHGRVFRGKRAEPTRNGARVTPQASPLSGEEKEKRGVTQKVNVRGARQA